MISKICKTFAPVIICFAFYANSYFAQDTSVKVNIDWKKIIKISKTDITLQVVVNPKLRRDSPIHAQAFQALRDLKSGYVRFVPWYPYPRLGVAELEPPAVNQTFWDFSLIDPLIEDFMNASKDRSVVINFSTIPAWLFKTDFQVYNGTTPNEEVWSYPQGTELRDPTGKELAGYYARLAGWYLQGGFTDELGVRHQSNHHYKFDYWEIFNEPEFEHQMTAAQYTARYDAVVAAVRKVAPAMKFVGISLAYPAKQPEFFEYFLNPKNHRAGIPVDMISYHFYAQPTGDQPLEAYQFTIFEQADKFVETVRFIESIRKRLAPRTGTMINEIGSILPDDVNQGEPGKTYRTADYWNLSGALFAYLYVDLAEQGIDVLGESQLVGFPGQFPSVTMLDWDTGKPNARYWVLKLLKDNFAPPVKIIETKIANPAVRAQAFSSEKNTKKILLINKRNRAIEVGIPDINGGELQTVDQTNDGITIKKISGEKVKLNSFAVAVLTLPDKN